MTPLFNSVKVLNQRLALPFKMNNICGLVDWPNQQKLTSDLTCQRHCLKGY